MFEVSAAETCGSFYGARPICTRTLYLSESRDRGPDLAV